MISFYRFRMSVAVLVALSLAFAVSSCDKLPELLYGTSGSGSS